MVEIPAINTDNKIIAGHQRLTIMKLLGRENEEIDVRVPSRMLTEEEFREYNLRSNKNLGSWDWGLLDNFTDTELFTVGFDQFDIAERHVQEKIHELGKDIDHFHFNNEPGWEEAGHDLLTQTLGYNLSSFWPAVDDANTKTGPHFLPLPLNEQSMARNQIRYSRTHPNELERIVKTYMRPDDYFIEVCSGWCSF